MGARRLSIKTELEKWTIRTDGKRFRFTSTGHKNLEDLFMQMKIADGYDAFGEIKITYADFKCNLTVCLSI